MFDLVSSLLSDKDGFFYMLKNKTEIFCKTKILLGAFCLLSKQSILYTLSVLMDLFPSIIIIQLK